MNRGEFLAELRAQLADFSEEAREDALKFYEEYLDEAGPENEAIVLAELGSPQKVARIIRANCDSGMPETESRTVRGAARHSLSGASWRAPRAPQPPKLEMPEEPESADGAAGDAPAGPDAREDASPDGAAPENGGTYRRPAYDYSAQANEAYGGRSAYGTDGAYGGYGGYGTTGSQGGQSGSNRTLWIILLIVTCPLWIGALFGLIGGAFGLVGGMIGLFFGGIGTMIAGFAALGGGIGLLFSSVPSGILMIGISLLCVACGALLSAFALWVTTKLVPLAARAVRWLWRRLFGNGR